MSGGLWCWLSLKLAQKCQYARPYSRASGDPEWFITVAAFAPVASHIRHSLQAPQITQMCSDNRIFFVTECRVLILSIRRSLVVDSILLD